MHLKLNYAIKNDSVQLLTDDDVDAGVDATALVFVDAASMVTPLEIIWKNIVNANRKSTLSRSFNILSIYFYTLSINNMGYRAWSHYVSHVT